MHVPKRKKQGIVQTVKQIGQTATVRKHEEEIVVSETETETETETEICAHM